MTFLGRPVWVWLHGLGYRPLVKHRLRPRMAGHYA